jgi:CelD/BcsL family acetyltransferase involved in cellulose biosynthesis
MKGRVIPVNAMTARDVESWNALNERVIEPNPLYEPDCLIPAARHQTFGADIKLAVAEEGGRWYAALPLRRVARWHKFPYPIASTQVRRMIYQGTPLLDRDRSVDAMEAVFAALVEARRSGGGRVFALQEMTAGSGVEVAALQAARNLALPAVPFEAFERGFLVREAGHTLGATVKSETRRNLAKKRRRLARDLSREITFCDRGHDPAAIGDYIALEASGYKGSTGVALTTVPGEVEYFHEMCTRFASADRLHLLSLMAGSDTLAMDVWLRGREGVFMIKTSYDERYAAYSPGLNLHLDAMVFFHDKTDAAWLDTCTYPGNELFLRTYPDRRRLISYFVMLDPSWKHRVDQLAMQSFMSARPIHKWIYERRQNAPLRKSTTGMVRRMIARSASSDQLST